MFHFHTKLAANIKKSFRLCGISQLNFSNKDWLQKWETKHLVCVFSSWIFFSGEVFHLSKILQVRWFDHFKHTLNA